MTYKEQLLDPRWQKKRLVILDRDGWTCRYCGNTKKTLHVHHNYYIKGNLAWDYPDDSLCTLCSDCHEIFHVKDFTDLEYDIISSIQLIAFLNTDNNPLLNRVITQMNNIIKVHKLEEKINIQDIF